MPALRDPQNKLGKFCDALGPSARVYTRIIVKTVCVHHTQYLNSAAAWAVAAGHIEICALPEMAPSSVGTIVRTKHLVATRHEPLRIAPGEIGRTLAALVESGSLPMFEPGRLLQSSQSYNEDVDFYRLPSLTLQGEGFHIAVGDPRELTTELRESTSFETFEELMAEMGFGGWRDRTQILVNALPIADFHPGTEITEGTARVRVRLADGADPRLLKLAWRVIADNGDRLIARHVVDSERLQMAKIDDGTLAGFVDIPMESGQTVECWLSYGGVAQGEVVELQDPRAANPRYVLHEILDPGAELLAKTLLKVDLKKGQRRDSSDSFEIGVAHVLHLLGFRTQHYAKPLSNGPDIIAYTDDGNVMIVECSLTSIAGDSGKVNQLQERIVLAREKLEAASSNAAKGGEVLGVAVVAIDNAEATASERAALAKKGIATLCVGDLRGYLARAVAGKDEHRKVFAELFRVANPSPLDMLRDLTAGDRR